jgi:hypothetical protein
MLAAPPAARLVAADAASQEAEEGCSRARLHGSGRPAACLVAGVGGSRDGIHAPGPRFHVAVVRRRAVRTLADADEGGAPSSGCLVPWQLGGTLLSRSWKLESLKHDLIQCLL